MVGGWLPHAPPPVCSSAPMSANSAIFGQVCISKERKTAADGAAAQQCFLLIVACFCFAVWAACVHKQIPVGSVQWPPHEFSHLLAPALPHFFLFSFTSNLAGLYPSLTVPVCSLQLLESTLQVGEKCN